MSPSSAEQAFPKGPMTLIATTTMGLEQLVTRELRQLGIPARSAADETGRIFFSGSWRELIRANLWLRTAGRVLIELARFDLRDDFAPLFDAIDAVPWEEWMPQNAAITVEARSVHSTITSVPALQRVVKKGIVNRLTRHWHLSRLAEDGPAYTVELAVRGDRAVLTLDTSGAGLHRRGYRKINAPSPLRETLASALVQLSVWRPGRPLIDPFCASGTIPIEAAMLGRNIAPGLKRTFAAEHWPISPKTLWEEQRAKAREVILPPLAAKLIGCDIDAGLLRTARFHAQNAGVADDIVFRQADFRDLTDSRPYGCVIGNPPYGDRVGEREEFRPLYESIPGVLAKLPTWSHYLITSWNDFESIIGQKADRRRKLYNGRIECTYFQFLGPRPPKGFFDADSPQGENSQEEDTLHQSQEQNTEPPEAVFTGLTERDTRQIDQFARCLSNRAKHLSRYPKRGITSYRVYDRDFPEVPLAIDLFEGQWLHLAEYERPDQRSAAAHRLWLDALVQRAGEILGISPENCFIKRRTRQKGKSQYEKLSSAGTLAEVHENGLTFLCNMSDYLDVGLFLDHRITRSMVSRMAGGKRFLNLFCYTGSFTCAAAAGGAARTVSVDLSSTYLDWAEKNMAKNGFGTADQRRRHRFIREDAIEYLSRCRETFDLCVCDPPTYSNSKKLSEDWDVQKRHAELLTLLAERMAPGGTVFFSNNFRRFKLDSEALEPFYTIRDISAQTVPEEYRNKRIHSCWRLMRRGE